MKQHCPRYHQFFCNSRLRELTPLPKRKSQILDSLEKFKHTSMHTRASFHACMCVCIDLVQWHRKCFHSNTVEGCEYSSFSVFHNLSQHPPTNNHSSTVLPIQFHHHLYLTKRLLQILTWAHANSELEGSSSFSAPCDVRKQPLAMSSYKSAEFRHR